MKKLITVFILFCFSIVSFGQSDFSSIDLTVNLNPVVSIELERATALITFNTIEEWTGETGVWSGVVNGVATSTGSNGFFTISGGDFGNSRLNEGIGVGVWTPLTWRGWSSNEVLLGQAIIPVESGVHDIDIQFWSTKTNLLGVPAGSYLATYDFQIFAY